MANISINAAATCNIIVDYNCVQANTFTTLGYAPPGTIIAVMPHVTGAFAPAACGVVSTYGWQRASGHAIPGGNTLTGNTPNISDSRFIRGNSTSGPVGGASGTSLVTGNLPNHTHALTAHNHSSTVSFTTSPSPTCAHTHSVSNSFTSSGGDSITMLFHNTISVCHSFCRQLGWASPWTSYNDLDWQLSYHTHTNGGISSSSLFGSMPHTHTISTSGGVCDYTGSTAATGGTPTATALSNLPPYLTAIFLIRVK